MASTDQQSSDQLAQPPSTTASSTIYTDDELGIVEMMKSMGINQFDHMVPVALNEYARSKKNMISFELHHFYPRYSRYRSLTTQDL